MKHPKPCKDCGKLTVPGNRCQTCATKRETTRAAQRAPRPHYNAEYQRKAKIIRETAVSCWICGKGYDPADPWQADHVTPRAIDSVLLPAHRSCNIRRAHGLAPVDPARQQPGEGSKHP